MIDVFVHDYGNAVLGPLFKPAYAELQPDLALSKRTKAYKVAKSKQEDLDSCLATLSRLMYKRGQIMNQTP